MRDEADEAPVSVSEDIDLLCVVLALLEGAMTAGAPDRGCVSSSTTSSERSRFFLLMLAADLVVIAIVVVCD